MDTALTIITTATISFVFGYLWGDVNGFEKGARR